jgi:hypothetical protein
MGQIITYDILDCICIVYVCNHTCIYLYIIHIMYIHVHNMYMHVYYHIVLDILLYYPWSKSWVNCPPFKGASKASNTAAAAAGGGT